MDLLRSEPMQLARLIVPMESAHRTISYLGDLSLFQFQDVILFHSLRFCPSLAFETLIIRSRCYIPDFICFF